ncbi:MAG: TonB-dependent receptor [Flavobacterium sp.]|nr:TonB-dependent receptor [Flavobacterium sp.]
MKSLLVTLILLASPCAFSQTIDSIQLEEVILITPKKELNLKQAKPLASIDDYLEQSGIITMIKRGGYAWEPVINSMATERTLVTIEGMHVFGACTDKMDPITSYVEVSNLAEASITSGQHGSTYGSTIGGAVNLVRNRTGFGSKGWKTTLSSGFETNASQKIFGAAVNYSQENFFMDTDVMSRDSENYTAGNNIEVPYSQFSKLNLSATSGLRLGNNKVVEASVIYDKATDVGYPALPMDVSLAEAIITSVTYEVKPSSRLVSNWESKIYYNQVTHIMDDTQRENVAIHMDMPGKTKTFGGYSVATGKSGKHNFKINLNAYYNISDAEMTMYPDNPDENLMFMLTWPDVRTLFSGIFIEESYALSPASTLRISGGTGYHNNTVASEFGLQSMRIFYPDMPKTKERLLKNLAATYSFNKVFSYSIGIGYGERAPSVSEGYGFYLFNSFDNFDYVGNPMLKNEKSIEGSISVGYKKEKIAAKISSSYFHIIDYIIGMPDPQMLPMTIGANGVKLYTSLPYASIFNANAEAAYKISPRFTTKLQLQYNIGNDNGNENLPFISPFSYNAALAYQKSDFSAEVQLHGNNAQRNFAPSYGEDATPAYAIVNFNSGYLFRIGSYRLHSKVGIDNMLDAYYSTFGDWNNIPRQGRNFYLNFIFQN